MSSLMQPGSPVQDPAPAPASGAQPPTRQLRLAVAAERLHGLVQPRFLTTLLALLALGSTLAALSVVLAWVLH